MVTLILKFVENKQGNGTVTYILHSNIHNYMPLKPEIHTKIWIWEKNSASEIQVNIFR